MDKRQKLLAKACEIALRHPDLHPFHVAVVAANADEDSDDFEAFLAGLLHDSVEDEYADYVEFTDAVFPASVIDAITYLTRNDGENYWDYIERIRTSGSDLAKRVKLADALVNLNRSRADFGHGSKAKRYERVIKELS